jgi:hypothetical protein
MLGSIEEYLPHGTLPSGPRATWKAYKSLYYVRNFTWKYVWHEQIIQKRAYV